MRKRIEEFDILKGIGILLVVIGHCTLSNNLHCLIYSFHMPLFFMVSGFFYHIQEPRLLLIKTFNRLLIPYIFFVLLNITFFWAINFASTKDFILSLNKCLDKINFLNEDCVILYRSIWFLLVMFLVTNTYNYLYTIFKDNWLLWLSLIVLTIYVIGYYIQFKINLPFFLDSVLSVILLYHIGHIARRLNINKFTFNENNIKYYNLVFFVALSFFTFTIAPQVDFKSNVFPFWIPILSFLFIISLYGIICFIPFMIKRFLIKCGIYSISILGFHRIFQDALFIIYSKIGISNQFAQIAIFVIGVICAILPLSVYLGKYIPLLIGVRVRKDKSL